ncbi:hypothetical protein PBCVAN69C_690L [Paramecium bursaria Chlorella virus AN69C]|nr:hypothetical protein PBCVAN69C_690L [Paramecium bursaria Chlorella virus AN69C]AGE53931.1 hypothetical protein PBCVIL3A_484R [Paramecium bursaria Chlorella virus IL3A]AGE57360.1 hypothetical protein PBCVNEJV4_488R [Paramecium bursaria Chlorella virus NE-JV-4]
MLKVLVYRILEANSFRELLVPEKIKDTKKQIPQIIDMICSNYNLNKDKFEQLNVDPVEIQNLQPLQNHLEKCSTPELVHLAEIAIFIMERETFKINNAILESQN